MMDSLYSKGSDHSSNELYASSELYGNSINLFFFFFLIVIRLIICQGFKERVHPGSFTVQGLLKHFFNYLELMPSEGGKKQIGI